MNNKILLSKIKYKLIKIIPYLNYRLYLLGLKKYNFFRKDVVLFFFIPELNFRAGGILSIYYIMEVTRNFLKNTIVLPVTLSKLPKLRKIDWFDNDWDIYNIYYLAKYLKKTDSILIHVPESFFIYFCELIKYYNLEVLAKKMKVNILNQNDELLPSTLIISKFKPMFHSLTMTLAFKSNVNNKYSYLDRKPYFISSWFYNYTVDSIPFEKKENICIVSHDPHPLKVEIINVLQEEYGLKCIEIKNMPFHEFQVLQRKAKWSISFGEGYDNYFAGAFFKDGVGFGVYSPTFFPESIDSNNLPITIFNSYKFMRENILTVIKQLDNKLNYEEYVAKMKGIVLEHNSPEIVQHNLKRFYNDLRIN